MKLPALFLDRDGVINVDHAYVHRIADFQFIDGIFELVAAAKTAGYRIVVVTNQAGIGRGYYTESDFQTLMYWVRTQFSERGGDIDGVYFCPYHPDSGVGSYRKESDWRKPGPGMLLQAAIDLDIDLGRSIMIGDKDSDMLAASRAGVHVRCLFRHEEYVAELSDFATHTIKSLLEVLQIIRESAI